MNTVIWKFPITSPLQSCLMPKHARILSVQTQAGNPTVWALVDPEREGEHRHFRVVGTGHDGEIEYTDRFLGTCQLDNGLVFHVFERAV